MQYQWTLLRAGSLRLDGGGMFGVVPRPIWSRLTEVDEQNRIPLQTNCLLLDGDGGRILIETGFGDKWTDRERGFYDLEHRTVVDALAERSVAVAEIEHIVLSHLHFDHAAALTRLGGSGEPVSTFPNATIHVQQREWDDARANRSTMTRTYLESHLRPIADQVRCVDGEAEILPGVRVMPLPGHTWGQQGICFDDAEGTVCFPGDVMPTANHVGPAFSMGYDMLPYDNMLTKQALLERACAERWRLALDHEPGEAVVRVTRNPDRPERFQLKTE
ncbi:MAG: MBL fold metallo-hydrolase [Planctomycetota bacterium]|jgi:glyoxylase-like metal-dependent hydrolase (beta-lactamase superfamily II)